MSISTTVEDGYRITCRNAVSAGSVAALLAALLVLQSNGSAKPGSHGKWSCRKQAASYADVSREPHFIAFANCPPAFSVLFLPLFLFLPLLCPSGSLSHIRNRSYIHTSASANQPQVVLDDRVGLHRLPRHGPRHLSPRVSSLLQASWRDPCTWREACTHTRRLHARLQPRGPSRPRPCTLDQSRILKP